MSYFIFKDETPADQQLQRKRYDILLCEKIIYIDRGCKLATQETDKSRKDTKDKEATPI